MSESALEFFAERAAIMQYDGNLSRPDSEYFAVVLMRRYCARMGIDEPRDHWMKAMPRAEWSDAEGRPVMKREPYVPPQFKGKG
jgi:hypothetical protein